MGACLCWLWPFCWRSGTWRATACCASSVNLWVYYSRSVLTHRASSVAAKADTESAARANIHGKRQLCVVKGGVGYSIASCRVRAGSPGLMVCVVLLHNSDHFLNVVGVSRHVYRTRVHKGTPCTRVFPKEDTISYSVYKCIFSGGYNQFHRAHVYFRGQMQPSCAVYTCVSQASATSYMVYTRNFQDGSISYTVHVGIFASRYNQLYCAHVYFGG